MTYQLSRYLFSDLATSLYFILPTTVEIYYNNILYVKLEV